MRRLLPVLLLFARLGLSAAADSAAWDSAPLSPEALERLRAAENAPTPAEAVRRYGQALRLAPASGLAHDGLARSLLQLDRAADALRIYRRLQELHPDEPAVLIRVALAIGRQPGLRRRHVREALDLAERAVAIDPAMHEAWYVLSVLRHLDGNYLGAAEAIRRAFAAADNAANAPLAIYERQETACNDALLVVSPLN